MLKGTVQQGLEKLQFVPHFILVKKLTKHFHLRNCSLINRTKLTELGSYPKADFIRGSVCLVQKVFLGQEKKIFNFSCNQI